MVKQELVVFLVMEVCAMVLLAVGCSTPVMQSKENNVQFTMWEKRLINEGTTLRITLRELQDCDITKEKLQAMSAFSLIAIGLLAIGCAFTILDVLHRPTHKWATEIVAICAWIPALIVWCVGLALFREPVCGGSGFVPADSNWQLGYGFILCATGWAVLMVIIPVEFIIKAWIRPMYWTPPEESVEPEDKPPNLRRRKSKRSFVEHSAKYENA